MPHEPDDRPPRSLSSRVDALETARWRARNAMYFVIDPDDPNAEEIPTARLVELREFFQRGLSRQRHRKATGKLLFEISWKAIGPIGAVLLGALNPTIGSFIQHIWKGIRGS